VVVTSISTYFGALDSTEVANVSRITLADVRRTGSSMTKSRMANDQGGAWSFAHSSIRAFVFSAGSANLLEFGFASVALAAERLGEPTATATRG
jgi:hypothetical protein